MKKQNKAYIFAFIAVILWSTVSSAFKVSLKYLSPFDLLFIASFSSMSVLFIISAFSGKLTELFHLSRSDIISSAILGFLNPFLYYIILFKAYSLLPAQEALILNYTWPITLILLSILILKQKISLKSLFAIIISFFGVLVIATHGNILPLKFGNFKGSFLAFFSTIIWSIYWIYNIKDKRDDTLKLLLNFVFGFVYISIVQIFFFNYEMPEIKGILSAIYIGFFEMGITFILWLKALKFSKSSAKVGNLIYITPFFALIVISIVLKEKIMLYTVIGFVFVMTGIILQHPRKSNKHR